MSRQRDGAVTPNTPGRSSWVSWAVLALILLVAVAVMVPNCVRPRVTIAANACLNNLRQIDGAKHQWALERQKADDEVPAFEEIAPYLARDPRSVMDMRCPDGPARGNFLSSYEIGAVTNFPKCKIQPEAHVLK